MLSRQLIYFSLFTFACSTVEETPYVVEHRGALHEVMQRGQITANIALRELENKDHLYALGAAEGLKGEILILNSMPYTATAFGNKLAVDSTFKPSATLLVWAQVPQWQDFLLPDSVRSYQEFESFIEAAARQKGLATDKPFPFLLEGKPATVSWHVIDWPAGDTEHSHEKHQASGLQGVSEQQPMQILGFYSMAHKGVFTHHSTNMHLHGRSLDGKVFGHLDELELADSMVVKLPR
ncbi:MAG: decarboxylase [Bacteroidetes bacterium]|nr:decarboxylase [Bacteroidota bacterium]